jgi:signal transduction histidine kinase
MTLFSSLTNRIFFATAALAVLTIGVAVYRVNVAVTSQAEQELHRGIEEAGTLLEEYRTTLFEHYSREAWLVADLSNLKAAVATLHVLTVQKLADEYQRRIGSDLFLVTDPSGRVLAEAGRLRSHFETAASKDTIARATRGRQTVALWPHQGGVIQVVSVPSLLGPELVGTVSMGFSLDEQTAARFKKLTNSEIAFAVDRRVEASTLPSRFNDRLGNLIGARGIQSINLDDNEYVVLSRPLPLASDSAGSEVADSTAPLATALILRSRTERLRFLKEVHREMAVTAILAVFAATILSYGVARTVTRPLGAITATMREMAATGDLTRKIALSPNPRWEDEDARLLATTFNTMTESIARFQRETAQRERLFSLGRLSTVVAHEIRNPLMIIKAALRSLKQEPPKAARVRTAVADIDEEVTRLNRIVTEVLDFARPIRFELAPVDLNALCEDAVRAISMMDGPPLPVRVDVDRGLPEIVTDGERLRLVLVNVLTNARHAVLARAEPAVRPRLDSIQGSDPKVGAKASAPAGSVPGSDPNSASETGPTPGSDPRRGGRPAAAPRRSGGEPIVVTTSRVSGDRIAIEVRDRGIGIGGEDLARMFDPFFTTRRTGTGLGLAISKNIIEGLGGTITVSSRPGHGTDVRIELPARPVESG